MEIDFSDELRAFTIDQVTKMHLCFDDKRLPESSYSKKCDNCSLINICSPNIPVGSAASNYLKKFLYESSS